MGYIRNMLHTYNIQMREREREKENFKILENLLQINYILPKSAEIQIGL